MKSITQKDLQSLYQSPSAENTEAIREMLSNLPDAEETGRTAGFRKYRLAFILAAILLLIIGITVAAVNSNGNGLIWVTWGGKQLEPAPLTSFPEKEDGWSEEKSRQMQAILDTVPDQYYATIDWLDGFAGSVKKQKRKVNSPEKLLEILDAAGYPHPTPLIPDGCSFNDAELLLGCVPEGEYRLVSRTVENGFALEQYRIDPDQEVIIGYNIRVWIDTRSLVTIASLLSMSKESSFGFDRDEGLTVEPVSVPGMEEAIYIRHGQDNRILEMIRELEHPVAVRTAPLAFADDLPEKPKPTGTYIYVRYSIPEMSPEDVLPIFSEKPREQGLTAIRSI